MARPPATSASRGIATAASSRCTATSSWASRRPPHEDHEPFETVIHELKHELYHADIEDTKLTVDDLKQLVSRFKALVKERTGKQFPADPWKQLEGAVGAVFGSWMNDRAIVYRRKYGIPAEWGTAVNVQAMVFGNTGANSGSGVAFTRDPATGEKGFYGEFLINAQGEDVVAGVRTPSPWPISRSICPRLSSSWSASARSSSPTSRTCRTSSSPSRMARSSCSRPATASAPASPPSVSPSRW